MASGRLGPPQVKFVGHDAIGLPVKRKQVHQACLPCRKRKKRCHHLPATLANHKEADHAASGVQREVGINDSDTSDAAAQLLRFFHHVSDQTAVNSMDNSRTQPQPLQIEPAPPFLCDINPESILVEATMTTARTTTSDVGEHTDDQVTGVLLPASPPQYDASPACDTRQRSRRNPDSGEERSGPIFSVPGPNGTRLTIHLQETTNFTALARTIINRALAEKVLPTDTEWREMRDLYLAKIHPILPIFEKSTLINLPGDSDLCELIKATVCLAAATDPEAGKFLTFNKTFHESSSRDASKSRITVSFDEYSREMANFINGRLAELQEKQQLSLVHQIQVMAVTCLYWQRPNPRERFEPIYLYAKLACLVHTHGIHLEPLSRFRAEGQTDAEHSGPRVFKCLYALDRLLAAFAGRPVMFHNVDIIRIPAPDDHDPPSFRLFMSLILLLDQVIEMYRPNPKVTYVDVPVYERLAIDAGAQCEPDSILATLEVLYHAIGVLSVRMPRHRFRTAPECDTVPGPRYQHLPPSGVNARRSHSADRIFDVIRDYKLCPMPFVPYALTLSLSVSYRKWRFSQLPMFRARGGADFKKVLPLLQEMGAIWSSARLNAQLGQAVMLNLDRNEISSRKRSRADQDSRVTSVEPRKAGSRREHSGQAAPAETPSGTNRVMAAQDDAQPTVSSTPPETAATHPEAPSSPRIPADPAECHETEAPNNSSTSLDPSASLGGSAPSPATSSLAERPQTLPLTWTTPWSVDPPATANNSAPNSLASATGAKDSTSRPNPSEQPRAGAQCGQSEDAIPLPGDVAYWNELGGIPSLEGNLSDGNQNDFVPADDDEALFRSWDPRFAQSVDFSFSSNLDPGNPFAWPEYCNYMF